jgi:hypothetical protein
MTNYKVVLLTHVCDQVDLLRHFFSWYTELGISAFLVQDMGSTDGTIDALHQLSSQYPIDWFRLEERDLRKHQFGNTADDMAIIAREKHDPKWLLMCDVDEFLVLRDDPLDIALEKAESLGITSINVPCFNMTGAPLTAGADALASLSLRIAKPIEYIATSEQQIYGMLPRPYVFIRHPQKTIVMASAFAGYVAGTHGAHVKFGKTGEIGGARFNHYSIRGFDKFREKVRNTEEFLRVNNHLENWWAWQWRRWIRLEQSGQLREEYDSQFVSEGEQQQLLEAGVCVLDPDVSEWAKRAPGVQVGPNLARSAFAGEEGKSELAFNDWFISNNALSAPDRIDSSGWREISPFVFWLIEIMRPNLIVDIGSQCGTAYSMLCQAIHQNEFETKCISVRYSSDDTLSDNHKISINRLQDAYEMSRYGHFLIFRDGGIVDPVAGIADRMVDMIYIDGMSISALRANSFLSWLPKLSERGVILLSGINRRSLSADAKRLWVEASEGLPKFELFHGEGLGLLGVGPNPPEQIRKLFALTVADARMMRSIYARLGAGVPQPTKAELELETVVERLRKREEELKMSAHEMSQIKASILYGPLWDGMKIENALRRLGRKFSAFW